MKKCIENKKTKWLMALAKVVCILAIVFLMGALPVFKNQVSGIENYSPADSTLSLSKYLYPSEDFLTRFAYTAGDYQYYYNGIMMDGYAVAFSVLNYSPEQYETAKQFCFQEFTHTDEHQYQIGDYHFIEHLCYEDKNEMDEFVVSCLYPEMFNMFAYNDSLHTLLFLGYYESNCDRTTQLAESNFETFYGEVFAKYYVLQK